MKMHDFKYSEEQLSALSHFAGPALVIAGPGSGKTLTITARIHYLIQVHKVPPSQILIITYTKEAASSMQKRFLKENPQNSHTVTFATFHALFFSILKQECSLQSNCLLSLSEKKLYLFPILNQYHVSMENAEDMLALISAKKNGMPVDRLKLPSYVTAETFLHIFEAYRIRTRLSGKIDFDDMLLMTFHLFQQKQDVLEKWQKRFPLIMVDEFQDTNPVQYELLKMLAKPFQNLLVVGDDDQSIYGFRGASPDILRKFTQDYPGAKVYYLTGNYRSSHEIVEFSKCMIEENKNRFAKKLHAVTNCSQIPIHVQGFGEQKEEFGYITNRIIRIRKENMLPWDEMAVIFRTNREALRFSEILKNSQIPYRLSHDRVQSVNKECLEDVLSYMKIADGDTSRETFFQIINKPERGISREFFMDEKISLSQTAYLYEKLGDYAAVKKVEKLMKDINMMSGLSPLSGVRYLRKAVGYDKWIEENTKDAENTLKMLSDMEELAKRCDDRQKFIRMLENEKEKKGQNGKQGIRLLTMHAAKGLEFTYVCIPNVNEGVIPHGKLPDEESIEEERRLFYVAVTRAKKILDILYLTGSKEHPGFPSRFLKKAYSSPESSISSSNS